MIDAAEEWVAGVDGCPDGWVAAFVASADGAVRVRVVARFADVVAAPEAPCVIAVDIPIGLPERVGRGGRAAENAVRPSCARKRKSTPSASMSWDTDWVDTWRRQSPRTTASWPVW